MGQSDLENALDGALGTNANSQKHISTLHISLPVHGIMRDITKAGNCQAFNKHLLFEENF